VQHVAGHRVERTERLVHEQDVGLLGERAGQCRALAHAARQLVGPLVAEAVEVDRADQLGRPLLAVGAGHPGQPHRQLDVLGDGEPGEQRRFLEHHRGAAADLDLAAGRGFEAGDEIQDGRLAAPGCADQADELTAFDGEIDIAQRGDGVASGTEGLGDPAQ
jgi:hypothetical protein